MARKQPPKHKLFKRGIRSISVQSSIYKTDRVLSLQYAIDASLGKKSWIGTQKGCMKSWRSRGALGFSISPAQPAIEPARNVHTSTFQSRNSLAVICTITPTNRNWNATRRDHGFGWDRTKTHACCASPHISPFYVQDWCLRLRRLRILDFTSVGTIRSFDLWW